MSLLYKVYLDNYGILSNDEFRRIKIIFFPKNISLNNLTLYIYYVRLN